MATDRGDGRGARSTRPARPIVVGADVELGNFIVGSDAPAPPGDAARLLLAEVKRGVRRREGYNRLGDAREPRADAEPSRAAEIYSGDGHRYESGYSAYGGAWSYGSGYAHGTYAYDPQDRGRTYLTNGGCAYIDLDHQEIATAECASAHDAVASWHAMLRVAREALDAANAGLPDGRRIVVLANNSDGLGHSYGAHQNFCITRRLWNRIMEWRPHYLGALAAHQISSMVYAGAGKIGAEHGREPVLFQLTQRGDFFETLKSIETTARRPVVNTRDEALAGRSAGGRDDDPARLHVIFYDANLAQVACLLKVGVMQLVLAQMEEERVNPRNLLDDPLAALAVWGRDPALRARARLADGRRVTAVEHQLALRDDAAAFVEGGGAAGYVERAEEILALWSDTLEKLHRRDFADLRGRLDWVLKRSILERYLESTETIDVPRLKVLDHQYHNLDPDEGLFWLYERRGLIERVVSEERIAHLVDHAPEATRAWTRAALLRLGGVEGVADCDWDMVAVRGRYVDGRWRPGRRIELADPARWTREETESVFAEGSDFDAVADRLEALADGGA